MTSTLKVFKIKKGHNRGYHILDTDFDGTRNVKTLRIFVMGRDGIWVLSPNGELRHSRG